MKLAPIPDSILKTDATIAISSAPSVYGVETPTTTTVKCRLVERSTRRVDGEGKLVYLKGWIYVSGDVAAGLAVVEGGSVTISGRSWTIDSVERPRNPDGTVHHSKIYLR